MFFTPFLNWHLCEGQYKKIPVDKTLFFECPTTDTILFHDSQS